MTTPLTHAFEAERDALHAVSESVRAQLDALGTGPPAVFEAAVASTLDALSALDACRRRRERLAADPSAGAVGPDARAALVSAASEANDLCDVLAFALEHAAALGRDLLQLGHEPPAASRVYTASGTLAPAGDPARPRG